jgi:hypothetical protein
MTKFNLPRYRQLLAKKDYSTNKKKDLFDDPTFIDNHKKNYFALIQKYLGEIINPNVFRGQFIEMVNEDVKKSHKILKNYLLFGLI